MEERKPTEWSHEERARTVSREELWYELESLRRTIDAGFKTVDHKFALLGRKGKRAAQFPERGWDADLFRSTRIALNILLVVAWTAFVVVVVLAATR